MKRMLALLCAILMLTSAIACGKTAEPAATTTAVGDSAVSEATTTAATEPAETEPPKAFDSVPEQNLGGEFHIRYAQADNCFEDFHAETMNGDVKNDAIYERNLMVEEKLGVDIQISWTEYPEVNNECKIQVQSGTADFDLFGGHRTSLALSHQGFQYDLAKIPTLNLSGEWWDQSYVNAVTVNDSVYTIIGDAAVSTLLFVSSMTFNKDLMDEANIAYPYDLVREGKWTLDALQTMTADYGSDLNGDGRYVRENDRFSLIGWGTESSYSLFYSADFSFVNRDTSGNPVLAFDTDKLVNILEKNLDVWIRDNVYLHTGTADAKEHELTYSVFAENRALFSDIVLSKIGTFYSAMENDFGIVPPPKYDEEQKNYRAYLGYTIPVLFISAGTPDPERTGTIMEALCTASYDHVTPQMYEIVTKLQNARDEDSSEMIEIIIRNKCIDTAHFYDLLGYGSMARTVITAQNHNIASLSKTYEKVAAKEWDKIMAGFEELG